MAEQTAFSEAELNANAVGAQSRMQVKSFDDVKAGTAKDFRDVAALMTEAADEIAKGDLERIEVVASNWSAWGQMLILRHDARIEELRELQGIKTEPRDDV